jgi:hypothetical protein
MAPASRQPVLRGAIGLDAVHVRTSGGPPRAGG